jgi:hypothetical protein
VRTGRRRKGEVALTMALPLGRRRDDAKISRWFAPGELGVRRVFSSSDRVEGVGDGGAGDTASTGVGEGRGGVALAAGMMSSLFFRGLDGGRPADFSLSSRTCRSSSTLR